MKRRTLYVILTVAAVAAVVGGLLWRARSARQAQQVPARSTLVERGAMVVAVTAAGSIEPAARVGLTFETPGRVAEILVTEGDRVASGEALARVTASDLELQVEQSRAALAAAQSRLAQLLTAPRPKEIEQAEANLRAAEAQLSAGEARLDQLASGPTNAEIAAAAAQVAQARASKEIAQDSYDLIEGKGKDKEQANYDLYVAKQELAAAEARLQDVRSGASEAELRVARANVSTTAAQRDAARARLDQVLAGPAEEDVAEAEAQVEQAMAALQLAQLTLEKAILQAPFDGIVTAINVTPGELPPSREPPFVLLDDSRYHTTVAIDELDVSGLREGQGVEVTVEALPNAAVSGTIKSISPVSALDTGVVAYDVVIDLDPTSAPLRADMTANVTIIVEELTDVLLVPTWAVKVDRETGETYVHRRSAEDVERVNVALGVRHEGVVRVVSGLSEGDEVVSLEDSSTFEFGRP